MGSTNVKSARTAARRGAVAVGVSGMSRGVSRWWPWDRYDAAVAVVGIAVLWFVS